MQLNAYLNFNGNAAEALKFYERHLGARVEYSMTYGEAPPMGEPNPDQPGCAGTDFPRDWDGKIMHARMTLGNTIVMVSDAPPGMYKPAQGIEMTLNVDDPKEAERLFKALGDGGQVKMPLAETFWAEKFGAVTDRFGIPWMINCEGKMKQAA
jgi:PhnB protein